MGGFLSQCFLSSFELQRMEHEKKKKAGTARSEIRSV
jgi:hypothetical protein